MEDTVQKFTITPWKTGDDVTDREHLNEVPEALIAAGIGVNPGQQNLGNGIPVLDIPPAYTKARLVVTSNPTYAGLAAIDGKTPAAGDYILIATGGTPGRDGLWIASTGNWAQIVRLSPTQTDNPSAAIFPHGTVISIWDGSTAPRVFVAYVSGLATF